MELVGTLGLVNCPLLKVNYAINKQLSCSDASRRTWLIFIPWLFHCMAILVRHRFSSATLSTISLRMRTPSLLWWSYFDMMKDPVDRDIRDW